MADIAEQICLAIDEIVTERLKGINYDTTIIATIVDNKYADQNRYTCSNGSAQFVAFSKDTTYKINDSVQVIIPNNDYNQQKIIVGKYVTESGEPFNYIQPFQTIVDASSNLIKTTNGQIFSLLANEKYDVFENEITPIEISMWSETFDNYYSNFTRLGIQGQFRSWISNLKPISGEYGYRLEILSNNGVTVETQSDLNTLKQWSILYNQILNNETLSNSQAIMENTSEKWYDDIQSILNLTDVENTGNSFKNKFIATFNDENTTKEQKKNLIYSMLYAHGQITNLFLTSADMYGDPYNFQSFYTQEHVFDISQFKNIMGMTLFFYENSGSFYSEDKNPLPYKNIFGGNLINNLFTKDPYICLGYSLAEFDTEQAILYTADNDTYITKDGLDSNLNKKTIHLRWLHQSDDGIQIISKDSPLTGYEIRWYRFYMGLPSPDEYAGVYWQRLNTYSQDNNDNAYIEENNPFTCILNPAVNIAQEQIKAIVIYNGQIIRSNIITFQSEKPVASEATTDVLAGLSLWCEDNSYGNYFLYGQNNNLLNPSKANEILTLKAKFTENSIVTNAIKNTDIAETSPDLIEAKSIIWEFPLKNTMIVVDGFNYSFEIPEAAQIKDENGKIIGTNWEEVLKQDPDGDLYKLPGYFDTAQEAAKIRVEGNTIFITRTWEPSQEHNAQVVINNSQNYRIAKTYNATSISNTVKCTISKDSLNYSATKEMSFGIMGVNGTDATLVIDFDDNKTALTAQLAKHEDGTFYSDVLDVTARLYDFNHKEVDFNDSNLKLACAWKWYAYHEYTEAYEQELYKAYLLNNKIIVPEDDSERAFKEAESLLTSEEKKQYRDAAIPHSISLVTADDNAKISINKCQVSHNTDLSINEHNTYNYFLILQATVTGFGDYPLVAYKPIPIRLNHQYRNIIGPSEVIYDSSGNVDYYKEPYEIYWVDSPDKVNYILDTVSSYEDVILKNKDDVEWSIYNPYEEEEEFIGSISSSNILKPASIYTKNTEPYGIKCCSKTDNVVYWIQPLMILSNRYPSTTLNQWNGKSVELKEGYIVAPAIAAGKKNSDNTFSGVMLGDWSNTDTAKDITTQTGVYGFHHGMASFAFKEDGTAFIGKSGKGRIHFDGDSGVICSSSWLMSDNMQNSTGMYLDLDDGILKMQRASPSEYQIEIVTATSYEDNKGKDKYYKLVNNEYVLDDGSEFDATQIYYTKVNSNNSQSHFITLSANTNRFPLAIGTSASEASRNFKVDWDGTAYINNGIFKGTVTADYLQCSEGVIGGWTISTDTLSGNDIILNSSDGSIEGGILRTPGGGMKLDGYLTILNTEDTYFGFLQASMGTEEDTMSQGLGMRAGSAVMKATTVNVGMSFGSSFLSLTSDKARMEGTHLTLTADGGTMTLAGTALECTIDKGSQRGIYARFA